LHSLLKYLDDLFLTDEIFWEIEKLNIENLEDQKIIIDKMIVPNFQEMDKDTQHRFLSYLDEINRENIDCSRAFDNIDCYFDLNSFDKQGFVRLLESELRS
jgi:hypothetical protein